MRNSNVCVLVNFILKMGYKLLFWGNWEYMTSDIQNYHVYKVKRKRDTQIIITIVHFKNK